jgi:hypothetical protein
VVQGAWVKAAFGANEAQLGQVFDVGFAERAGSLGSIRWSTGGKKRGADH